MLPAGAARDLIWINRGRFLPGNDLDPAETVALIRLKAAIAAPARIELKGAIHHVRPENDSAGPTQ